MHRLLTNICNSSLILAIMVLGFCSPSAMAQSGFNSGPMVQSANTVQISEHVFVIPDGNVSGVPNVGIIIGTEATLVIDTGMGAPNGRIILEKVEELSSSSVIYLATTHVHPEHDLGAHAFPGSTQMIRSQAQIIEIEETGLRTANAFSSRSEVNRRLLEGAEFRAADISFEDSYQLDLGGVQVTIVAAGPNHTLGDTVFYVERDEVLFSGDIVMQALPAFASQHSSLDHWLESLDKLQAYQPEIIVPSHGPMGNTSMINTYREYLTAVKQRTSEIKAEGNSLDETTALLRPELAVSYGDSGRINGAIAAAYATAGN
ncbi:MAG: MBL fold metallo-hydrolase [Gammaproteobacteria bacterium]|nr:MBL fold metallo-hydrolase [Gammaproteobacteria bacterium]